ncbi:MAG: ComF family protein [Flavobacteriales bacterium]|nr:ComF family protein [Flavobacteriales bacterium]MCZ2443031.1 ComF family protein [Flavobacteriales bacterium]
MKRFWEHINVLPDIIKLIYPRTCVACGQKLVQGEEMICIPCRIQLPQTHFHLMPDNPVEKVFRGRAKVDFAASLYFFQKGLRVQHILHAIKYKQNKKLAYFLGEYYGTQVKDVLQKWQVDMFIPVPLHPAKLRQRGYNQSAEFAKGLTASTSIPTRTDLLTRTVYTETQTRKARFERWENVKDKFAVTNTGELTGKHIILVDDVITTGSTLESCAQVIQQMGVDKTGVLTIACAAHH